MPDGPEIVPLPRRFSLSVAGALTGALAGALIVAVVLAVSRDVPTLLGFALAGVTAVVVALPSGLLVAFLHPGSSSIALAVALEKKTARWRLLLAGPTLVAATFVVAQLSVRLLGAFPDRGRAGGVLVAAAALGVLTSLTWVLDRGALLLSARLNPPNKRIAAFASFAAVVALGIVLLVSGTTSGTGSAFALFGVLKRPELDLSPALHLLLFLGGAYSVAWWSRRRGVRAVFGAAAVALALWGGALLLARGMEFKDAVRIERSRSLASTGLGALRQVSDRDGDGFSSAFGGGDCDDTRADVFPGATDIPENGVDEDCRGGDKSKLKVEIDDPDKVAAAAAQLPKDANVLLLTIDTLRWDLGYIKKSRGGKLSPHLDALAKRSTTYENAYSLASYTSKSLAPMMIGRYPSETHRTFEHFDRFSPQVPFIQERLQKAGIHTTSIQGYWYFFFNGYGFERGWDVLDSTSAPKLVAVEGDKTSNGDKLADRTIENLKLRAEEGKRFFMWTHWVDPHAEYVPHEGFDFGSEPRERYDGEVAFVDAQVGRILDSLKELGLSDNTVVIVTSDHGEAFGEHGMIRHGFEVWEVLMRVPLIVHVPGASPRRVKVRRSFIDVAPTVLEVLGVERPATEDDFLRGTSLLRDVLAPEGAELEKRAVLVDMPQGPHNQQRRAFYDGNLKLITSAGRVLGLYDVANDPGEEEDLSEDTERVEVMQTKMNAYLDNLRQVKATR